jgi:hypothetical protein
MNYPSVLTDPLSIQLFENNMKIYLMNFLEKLTISGHFLHEIV